GTTCEVVGKKEKGGSVGGVLRPPGGGGGGGGAGGDGGSLTVFYQSLEDLKQIYVISRGGRGGKGGRAGEGGSGCRHCEPDFEVPEIEIPDLPEIEMPDLNQGKGGYYSPSKRFRPNVGNIPWAVRPRTALPSTLFEKTFLVKDERCITKPGGAPGSSGRDGEAGEMGHLYLVEQGIEFRPDQPTQRVELSSFEQNQVISLSKNLWETHQGALALLAPGSVMADEYYEYSGRLEQAYRIVWNALQPATDFLDERITLTLTETGELEIFSPEDIWLASQISEQDGTAQFAIEHVVQREEATQLAWVDFSGNQSNLSISLIDRARKSDILTTQFRLKYRVAHDQRTDRPRPSAYSTQYDGPVPAALVTQNHQQFTLNLGQLPIDSPYLRPGLNIEIELTAIRSLSGRSAEQRIVWRGKVEP
ncbi:MAG: hypothetical protein AAGF01_25875, partial [Cyanobacteria bacterium P01_G01_bin.38]